MSSAAAPLKLCLLLSAAVAATSCAEREARHLLAEGHPEQVLEVVRPTSATAFFLRARALLRLQRWEQARTELLLGLALDEESAEGHRLLGFLEERLGFQGAALARLERALALGPRDAVTRRAVGRLLRLRAHYRSEPAIGLLQREEARRELKRAAVLSPGLLARPASAQEARARCPGPPLALGPERPFPRGSCRRKDADRLVEQLRRRALLLACDGAGLAVQLEGEGCVTAAAQLWELLAEETPSDPRWPLQQARLLLARGELNRAQLYLQTYVFKSPRRRAAASVDAAHLLADSGHCAQAGVRAAEALAFGAQLPQQLASIRILAGCGLRGPAREAAQIVLSGHGARPQPELRALVEQAMSEAPR